MTQPSGPAYLFPLLSALFAVLGFALLQDAAYVTAGGALEYPLDDPYIHLAMAEQMRVGGYGVNAGEFAAAASSPLYPVLMMPFVGTNLHGWMPLVWNLVGLIAAAWLWGRILWRAGYGDSPLGLALAALGPVLLHLVGVAYTGMEHVLHVAASLAIVLGLLRFLDEGIISRVLIAGVILAPLLRFEGLALALMAAFVVMLNRRYLAGLGLMFGAAVPVAGFAWWLTTLGLDPLPSSVTAKLALPQNGGTASFILTKLADHMSEPRAQALLGYLLVAALLLASRGVRASGRGWLVLAVAGAGLAHLLVGRFGWMDRYEIYILATMAAGLFAAANAPGARRLAVLPALPLLFAASIYLPLLINTYPSAGNAVHLQQAQMGRFAKAFLKEPVAVNDLGHVAWQNPDYVLDIWGLANHEAREIRLNDPRPGWADELTDAHGVKFAMLYDHWFSDELGDDWVLLGQLQMHTTNYYLGGPLVNFYLTRPLDPAPYVEKIVAWQAGLPKGASFAFSPEVAQ